MQRRKYKYLYQLICTSVILVVVPTLLFYNVFWKKSFDEIERLNTEYYDNVLGTFRGTFVNEVLKFKNCVSAFSVNSKSYEESGGIFYLGTEKMEENNYYYWEASQELLKYSQKAGYDKVGCYYYEKDVVLFDDVKDTSESFRAKITANSASQVQKECINNFFSLEHFEQAKVIFAPIQNDKGKSEEILIGICTVLGKNKEKALIFYKMDQKDMEFFYVSVQGRTWEKYYILDDSTKEILFSIGNADRNIDVTDLTDHTDYYMSSYDGFGITFLIDVSEDDIQNNVTRFYHDMKVFLFYIILIMLGVCILTIYTNYRPMHRLLKNIKYRGQNEFDTIRNLWEEQNDLLTEQRMTIMDLLMNHLLYGISIPQKYIKELGVSSKVTRYCVFLIKNHVVKAADVDSITKEIEKQFRTLLFVTDLTGEKSTVIIAFMEHDNADKIKAWMEKWCELHIGEEYQLKAGCVVDKMDEIQMSLAQCVEKKDEVNIFENMDGGIDSQTVSEKVRNRTEINEKLKVEVLNYLDENYTDSDLSQTQVADYFQVSVYSLSKMFNNQVGMGFAKYINSKRIEHAKELLVTTELSVKEIAGMVGVLDDNYFSRLFRKTVGISPLEFRNHNK